MCRIAGILDPRLSINVIEGMVQQMCDLQKHGGPDDSGLYACKENNLVLGNRRLALVDLTTAGHQPMQYQERYFITYNGEIYNYLTLKKELEDLGYNFQNHTDTEVILAAFAQWNTQSFARLKGMYAFALWDSLDHTLYLVRDPAGIKPLYYSTSTGAVIFASEIRAFKPVPSLHQTDSTWPVYQMAYGHIPEPVSTLKDVKPLHKGCFFKFEARTGRSSMQSFEHYSYTSQLYGNGEINFLLKEKLTEAVRCHMLADARIGVFLSGGLDSSIIAMLASLVEDRRINTLSLYFEESGFSEKPYQDLLIDKLDCHPFQHLLQESVFQNTFPDILNAMDMPSCDGINTWFISKYAAEHGIKAVLSGIGADELFGGYPSFHRLKTARLLQQLPAATILAKKRSNSKKLTRLAYLNMEGIKGVYLFLRGHFSPREIARQLGAEEKQIWDILNDAPVLSDVENIDLKNQASWMEFNLYMQNQLLRDADVMSMIHGVEIRVPFLDHELLRLVLKMPVKEKYEGPRPKQLLINTFKEILPKEIWNRPKMGFTFPFVKWLGNSSYVKELMSDGNKNTQLNYQKFKEGKLHWSQFMSLIIMQTRGV